MSKDSLKEKISRRDILKNAAVGATAVGLGGLRAIPAEASAAIAAFGTAPVLASDRVLPLTSNSEIYVPPRGRGFMKFSFDFPEPSVLFERLRFSFRIYTFENTYAMDRDLITVSDTPDGMEIRCTGLVWAGGQEKTPAQLYARFRRGGTFIEWDVFVDNEPPD